MRLSLALAWRPRLWERERPDLLLLAAAVVVVLATWLVLLGWRPGIAMVRGDIKAQLHWFELLAARGGDWRGVVWDYRQFGGARLHDTFGTAPLARLCVALGCSPLGVLNALHVSAQVAIGFFATAIASDVAADWRLVRTAAAPPRPLANAAATLACLWLGAFAPIVGDRIWQSHFNILWGLAVVLALAALLIRASRRGLTATLAATSLAVAANGLAIYGHQIVIYGATAALPLLLALAFGRVEPRAFLRALLVTSVVALVAVALVAGELAGTLDLVRGTDFPRDAPDPARYNLPLGRLQDWVASLPWGVALIDAHRGPLQRHELLYPVGPLLLAAQLVPWRRARLLGWGLALSIALVLVFSMRLEPIAGWASALLPSLGLFRMPSRAALPVAALFLATALAALLRTLHAGSSGGRVFLAGGAALALFVPLLPAGARELLLWLCTGALVLARRRLRGRLPTAATAGLLLLLAAGSLAAFRERAPLGAQASDWLDAPQTARAAVLAAAPELDSSLVRVRQVTVPPERGAGMAALAGLSSVDGYGSMPNRYRRLVEALTGRDLRFGDVVHLDDERSGTAALERLYDVRYRLRWRGARPELIPAPEPAGPAWFPRALEAHPDFSALARVLLLSDASALRSTAHVVSSDPWLGGLVPGIDPACVSAAVEAVGAPRDLPVVIDVQSPARCLLVVSMSFAETLRAHDARGVVLEISPLYGAVVGVWVPAGASRITIAPEPVAPLGARLLGLAGWVGVALLAGSLVLARRAPMEEGRDVAHPSRAG